MNTPSLAIPRPYGPRDDFNVTFFKNVVKLRLFIKGDQANARKKI